MSVTARRVQIPIRLDPKLSQLLRDTAALFGKSVNSVVTDAVSLHVTRSVLLALDRSPDQAPPGLTHSEVYDNLEEMTARIYGGPLPQRLVERYAEEAEDN